VIEGRKTRPILRRPATSLVERHTPVARRSPNAVVSVTVGRAKRTAEEIRLELHQVVVHCRAAISAQLANRAAQVFVSAPITSYTW